MSDHKIALRTLALETAEHLRVKLEHDLEEVLAGYAPGIRVHADVAIFTEPGETALYEAAGELGWLLDEITEYYLLTDVAGMSGITVYKPKPQE